MNDQIHNELRMTRVFDAPRESIWRACRESEALKQWWGMPHGVTMEFCRLDFREGGELLFGTRRPDRDLAWGKCIYRRIVDGAQITLDQHRSDEAGHLLDSEEWPASMIEIKLGDVDGKTTMTVVHTGMASPRATVEDYRQGWSETLDRLAACLSQR